MSERKKAVTQLLKEIDEVDSRKSYMKIVHLALAASMEAMSKGKASFESLSVANIMTLHLLEEDITYKQAARKSADALHGMFKGLFELEDALESGEDVTLSDVVKRAYNAAEKGQSNGR